MPNSCPEPTRECPVDTKFLIAYGEMKKEIHNIHEVVANGNGLVGKVQTLEADMNQRKGSLKMLKLMLVIVGVIPIAIEVLRALKEIP